jgi:hypothetical protein
MNNEHSRSILESETVFGLKYFLNALMRIRDLFDPGSRILEGKIRVRDLVKISDPQRCFLYCRVTDPYPLIKDPDPAFPKMFGSDSRFGGLECLILPKN